MDGIKICLYFSTLLAIANVGTTVSAIEEYHKRLDTFCYPSQEMYDVTNLNDAKKECSNSPSCGMFYDTEDSQGNGIFASCPHTASIESSWVGSILYQPAEYNEQKIVVDRDSDEVGKDRLMLKGDDAKGTMARFIRHMRLCDWADEAVVDELWDSIISSCGCSHTKPLCRGLNVVPAPNPIISWAHRLTCKKTATMACKTSVKEATKMWIKVPNKSDKGCFALYNETKLSATSCN